MGFNISHVLKKKFINNEEFVQRNEVYILLKKYADIEIDSFDITRGIIRFKKISPLVRVHIKKHKQKIIFELQQKDIFVRDII